MRRELRCRTELWTLDEPFVIAGLVQRDTELIVVEISGQDPAWVRVDLEGDGLLDGYVFASFLAPAGALANSEHAAEPGDAD